jgi:hypothetical protein
MDSPVTISSYIMLKTVEPISKSVMRSWYRCAKEFLPNGIISSVQTTDDHGNLRGVTMVHREKDGEHDYIIPLTRDILDREAQPVVNAFVKACPNSDFDIEISSAQADLANTSNAIEVNDSKYTDLCTAWAKKQHEDWLKDRLDGGWRYGTTMSLKNKTHPLVRQWSELPDQFRKIDTNQPQALLDLLNDQGYSVIAKAELDGIMQLLKGGL